MDLVKMLIVDDQEPFRRAASAVVGALEGFEVVGEAESGEDSIAAVTRLGADMVLMDVNLPGMNGMAATRRIRELVPSTVVVLLSTYDRAEYGAEADECGAVAFLAKSAFDGDAVLHAWNTRTAEKWDVDSQGGDTGGLGDLGPAS
jgi:DNA-binding NarL/FixJ family response regulator